MKIALFVKAAAVAALAATGPCLAPGPTGGGPVNAPPPPPVQIGGTFTIHALGKMCLDFGGQEFWAVGQPVTLYWCNGTIAQEFDVQEIDGADHDFTLHLGTGQESNFCIGAHKLKAPEPVLEIETCDGSAEQQFAFDGDALYGGGTRSTVEGHTHIARDFVAGPQNDVTNRKTPIVMRPRELNENEYLRFVPTDNANRIVHSGFVSPSTWEELKIELGLAGYGSVVVIPGDTVISTDAGPYYVQIPAGVTLRGYRKFVDNGPSFTHSANSEGALFEIGADADDVRVTGLRLQGAGYGTGSNVPSVLSGILIDDPQDQVVQQVVNPHRVIVDHVEFSRFTDSAVKLEGGLPEWDSYVCPVPGLPKQSRPTTVRIAGNSFFHNVSHEEGYGVSSNHGTFPLVERNFAYENKHSITSHYDTSSGYVAQDNFFLAEAPDYGVFQKPFQDIDVHGSGRCEFSLTCYNGGMAGDYVDVLFNTFLRTDGSNIKLRGQPCRMGLIDENVFTQSDESQAIKALDYDGDGTDLGNDTNMGLSNQFGVTDPTSDLAVGDFDGDGIDDVFVGTGTDWFYSSGGRSEWRWLRRSPEHASQLRFGDFDGDGRTDVIAVIEPGILSVSWGGVSYWIQLSPTPAAVDISHFAVGNFDGDTLHGDDVFMSDGTTWFVAPSGQGFTAVGGSSFPVSSLRFGDFDGDGITDVFGIDGNQWSISKDATGMWTPLAGAPAANGTDGLIVGDFDGDGKIDMGHYFYSFNPPGWIFEYSKSATSPYQRLRSTASAAQWAGHFAGAGIERSDVIWWYQAHLYTGNFNATAQALSRQNLE